MKLVEFRQHLLTQLADFPDKGEAIALLREIIFHFTMLMPPYPEQFIVTEEQLAEADKIINRLRTGEPFQYITGKALFLDFELLVNPSVLIPRPETAELPGLIQEELIGIPSSVIDLGTGSGCLAIALAKVFPGSKVSACDTSLDALQLASQNASNQKVEINLFWADMNAPEFLAAGTGYDLVVSNPPYISVAESQSMSPGVLNFEPHLALFAPGEDPLHFYRRIAAFAIKNLNKNGAVWLEINPLFADETCTIFKRAGMHDVRIYPDLSGKDRFIAAWN